MRSTGTVSPAVKSPARYSSGMRSLEIAANRVRGSSPSLPDEPTTSTTGDSGGMYQTMGMVRYSGCSGSATRYFWMRAQIGEAWAAAIQSSGIPSARAAATTSGSCGSRNTERWDSRSSCSSSTDAASVTRSASYRTRPR
ncbi:hypothetical protein D3C74_419380 [compost metagenome]